MGYFIIKKKKKVVSESGFHQTLIYIHFIPFQLGPYCQFGSFRRKVSNTITLLIFLSNYPTVDHKFKKAFDSFIFKYPDHSINFCTNFSNKDWIRLHGNIGLYWQPGNCIVH